jgi:WD40 repeat protein
LRVDPVTSPTDELSQIIVVRIGNGEEVTVVTESGTFTVKGNFIPFQVEIPLLPNTVHHLEVIAKVRKVIVFPGCIYGGYTMRTTRDGNGAPLTIVQGDPVPPTPSSPITVDNVSHLQQLTSFAPNARLVTDFVFRDDHEVISVGYESNISVWSADTGEEVRQIGNDQAGALVVASNSDGSLIATGGTVSDAAVRVWNTQSGEMHQLGTHPPYPNSLAFNPDGTRLASGSSNDSVIVWDVNSGQTLMTLKGDVSDRQQAFRSLYWKDGSTLIAAGSDAIYWWDTTTGSLLQRLAKPVEADFLVHAAFSQNGDRVAAAAQDAYLYFWDQAVGQWSRWPALAGSRVSHVSFSPDGQLLVAGTYDNRLLVWNVETGQFLAGYSTTSSSLAAVRVSPGGLYFASGGWGGPIRLWGIP